MSLRALVDDYRKANETSREAVILDVSVRAINEEERSAEFVATTERPAMTWDGPEILRMSGADLTRFEKNPVVLDSHARYSVENILGSSVRTWREGKALVSKIRFASTERANTAWTLVKENHLRAMSIGYQVNWDKALIVEKGESVDDEGENITGPMIVQKEWKLSEQSLVPVPADEDALRRSLQDARKMAGHGTDVVIESKPEDTKENTDMKIKNEKGEEIEVSVTDEMVKAEKSEARRREVASFCPERLKGFSEELLLDEALTVEQIREALKAKIKAEAAPVGTPEPPEVKGSMEKKRTVDSMVEDGSFLSGLRMI